MQADDVAASTLIMNASLLDPKQTSVSEYKRIRRICNLSFAQTSARARTHTHVNR